MNPNTTVKIPCRISYAYIADYRQGWNGEPRYSCTLIVDKNDSATVEMINAALDAAKSDGITRKWNDSMPDNVRTPFKDGDIERPEDEAFKNAYFINASSTTPPRLVDQQVRELKDKDRYRIYSGCYCNVYVEFFPYKSIGADGPICGIAAELGNIQLVREGESLVPRSDLSRQFDPIPEE